MNLNDALALIASFRQAGLAATNQNAAALESLLKGSDKSLPLELKQYIEHVCPEQGLAVEGVGHPVELLKPAELAWKPSMYADLTGELAQWQKDWLLIAHEGGDPIIIKSSDQGELSPVYSAMQGMGFWDFAPIADSIGQFLVCICAIEHALNFPGLDQPLDDDFNLAPAAANWLFSFLRKHAGAHYDEWASVFENYQMH